MASISDKLLHFRHVRDVAFHVSATEVAGKDDATEISGGGSLGFEEIGGVTGGFAIVGSDVSDVQGTAIRCEFLEPHFAVFGPQSRGGGGGVVVCGVGIGGDHYPAGLIESLSADVQGICLA